MNDEKGEHEGVPKSPQETAVEDRSMVRRTERKHGKHTIKVTQEDIDLAKPRDSTKCMFALGVKQCIPGVKNVSVDFATTRFTDTETGLRYVYATPPVAAEYLMAFEFGIKPLPFRTSLNTLYQILPKKSTHARIAVVTRGPQATSAPVKIGGKAIREMKERSNESRESRYIRRFGIRVPPSGGRGIPRNLASGMGHDAPVELFEVKPNGQSAEADSQGS